MCLPQNLVQRIRQWWPSGIDIWVSVRLGGRHAPGFGHGRDGFNVRSQRGNASDSACFCRFVGTTHAGFGQASVAIRTIPLLVALAAMALLSAPDLCLAKSQVVETRLAFLRVHAGAVRSGDCRSHLERDNTFLGTFADKASGSRSQAAHLIGWLSWLRHRAGNF